MGGCLSASKLVSGVSSLGSPYPPLRADRPCAARGPENNTTLEMSDVCLFPMEVPRSSIFRIDIAQPDQLVMVRTRLR
jgi:hypothetical protein